MTVVQVTSTVGTTAHYFLVPEAIVDVTGSDLGITLPDIVNGWITEVVDNTPLQLSLALDNAYLWDLNITFQGAPPIIFSGFNPGAGGDLLTLLYAQGWIPL